MENLFETLGNALRPAYSKEITNYKEAYETLLQEYARMRNELDQWEAGGILWTWTDVECYAEDEMNVRLSEQECKDILAKVMRHHDACIGITWDSFHSVIEEHINKNNK